jgi:hypothetical protein
MAWPTDKAVNTYTNAGSDSPKLARGEIDKTITNVNDIIDYFVSGPIKIQGNEIEATRTNDNLFIRASGTGTIELEDNTNVTGVLAVTGNITATTTIAATTAITAGTTLGVTGASTLDGVTITDNTISTNATNANLEINTNGTGKIVTSAAIYGVGDSLGGNIVLTDQADGDFMTSAYETVGMLNPSGLQVDSAGSYHYSTMVLNNFSTNANNAIWATRSNHNTHGTNAYLTSGQIIFQFFGAGWNGDTDGTGYYSGNTVINLYASENHSISQRGGGFVIKTLDKGTVSGSTAKLTIEDHVMANKLLEFKKNYQETITALTSATTIAVDCSLSSVFSVSLSHDANFVLSNLPTGGSISIIIKLAAINKTATFTSDGSTKIKFPDGDPVISQTSGAIDFVVVFFDGTDFLGSITQNYRTS